MKKVALVTNSDYPELFDDDKLLAGELALNGVQCVACVWDDPSFDSSDYQLIILRSVWEYHRETDNFLRWLKSLDAAKVYNKVSVIEANLHKSYLLDFEKRGLKTIATTLVKQNESIDLLRLASNENWEEVVIKPAISLDSANTTRLKRKDLHGFQGDFELLLTTCDLLIQPFVSQILTDGEISFVFIENEFTHALRKTPTNDDFRVQSHYGGIEEIFIPDRHLIRQAKRYIDSIDEYLLYARVDGVIIDDEFALMELELIDPVLYFGRSPEALYKFSNAISKLLSR